MSKQVENKQAVSEPEVSEAAAQPSSPPADHFQDEPADLEARLEARIQQAVERRFQSAKDKRWAQLEKQYGELSELAQGREDVEPERGSGESSTLAQARRLLTMAGLTQDAEALDLLRAYRGGSQSATRLLSEIAELAVRRLNRAPARAGAVVQPGGGRAAPDLRADYERALKNLRPGDVAGLAELKRSFRKRGLEVF